MSSISVVIPSWNQGDYISATIESVLKILGPSDEVIIADAGSTDNTADNVAKYLHDPRVVWNSEPDDGYSDGLTKIASRIRGDLVGIMSSDDLYLDFDLVRIRTLFEDPEMQLVFADYDIIDAGGDTIGRRSLSEAHSLEDIFALRVIIPQSSTFFRREALLDQLPLSLDFDYIADIGIFNRICARGRWQQFDTSWSAVRRHPGSRTGKKNPGAQYLLFLEREYPEQLANRAVRSGALLLQARYQAEGSQKIAALKSLTQAFALAPISTTRHWLFSRTLAHFLPKRALSSLRKHMGAR